MLTLSSSKEGIVKATAADYRIVTLIDNYFEKKRLSEKSLFFRVIFAFVNSQLSLRFNAAAFACVLAP